MHLSLIHIYSDHADFYKVFEELKTEFGPAVCPIVVPFVQEHKVQCYVNMLEYKAYAYRDGKPSEVPIPEMGARLDGLRTAINEAVAETSDEAFEKYFSGETFTPEELIVGLSTGVRNGTVYPVFCGASQSMQAIDQLMTGLAWLAPTAEAKGGETATVGDDLQEIAVDASTPTAAVVFKTEMCIRDRPYLFTAALLELGRQKSVKHKGRN